MSYALSGKYQTAFNYLQRNKHNLYGKTDSVVYYLDTGVLSHYFNDYIDSTKQLSTAEKLMYDLYTKSISQEISSFIINDNLLDYPGEDYEDIYTNIFMSLNYYHQGKIDDAIVEINRASNKIQTLSVKHEAELIKARKAAKAENNAFESIEFHNSALVHYLALLYHQSSHNLDAAFADRHFIADAFLTQKKIYPFPEPSFIDNEFSLPADRGCLNIIAFSGTSPVKYEKKIQLSRDFVIAVPVMHSIEDSIHWIKVSATNITTGRKFITDLEEIESISNIAIDSFRIRSQIIYNKAVARSLVKGAATVSTRVIGQRLENNNDATLSTLGTLLKIFSSVNYVSNHLTENADLRISRYFPARVDIGKLIVPSGNYDIVIDFYDQKDGYVLASYVVHSFFIEAKKTYIIERTCLGR